MSIKWILVRILACLWLIVCLLSCSDKVDKSDIYTFKGMTVADYIRSCPSLSIYARLMDVSQVSDRSQSTVSSLLGIYGHFTVFVPTISCLSSNGTKTGLHSETSTEPTLTSMKKDLPTNLMTEAILLHMLSTTTRPWGNPTGSSSSPICRNRKRKGSISTDTPCLTPHVAAIGRNWHA